MPLQNMYDGTSAAGVRKARQDRHGSGSSTAAATTFALETTLLL